MKRTTPDQENTRIATDPVRSDPGDAPIYEGRQPSLESSNSDSLKRIIPIRPAPINPVPRFPAQEQHPAPTAISQPTDRLGRPLHDLRISLTDRCNFRCPYCMPREVFNADHQYLASTDLLNFEEIQQIAKISVELGVRKIRLTGGEPLLRKNIEQLVEKLAKLRGPTGEAIDLTLTTNGVLLPRKANALKAAGLQRVTISLDALSDPVFRIMSDSNFHVADVLAGIQAARLAGFDSIKINCVVKRGINDQEILPLANHFREYGASGPRLRFIEYMDVGNVNRWQHGQVFTGDEIVERLREHHPLRPIGRHLPDDVAERWEYLDGQGEIGIVASVSRAFCRNCSRARLSANGHLYTCLFASQGFDLRSILRERGLNGLSHALVETWRQRNDRYSELRQIKDSMAEPETDAPSGQRKIEMSYIGG